MSHLKITSIELSGPMAPTNGTFYISEDVPGASVTTLGTVLIGSTGLLAAPIDTAELVDGKTYKIKCKLACGTSYIKKYTVLPSCINPENLSIELLYEGMIFKGIKVLFTPVLGQDHYQLVIYKNAALGDPGAVFVNSYDIHTLTGEFIIIDPLIIATNIDFFAAIATVCNQGISSYSDFVAYSPKKIKSVATGVDGGGNRTLTVTLAIAALGTIIFQCIYTLADASTYGPVSVTVNSGDLTGDEIVGPSGSPAISSVEILEAIPALVDNSYLIIF